MKLFVSAAAAALLTCGSLATAQTLQMDLNALGVQVQNSLGAPSPFGGISHTGSVQLTAVPAVSYMAGIFIDGVSQSFNGILTGMTGSILLSSGNVTGGAISVTVNGVDTYTAQIAAVGNVQTFIGGGYTIQGLTFNGLFSSSMFGNVDVTPWNTGGLAGSFLQFNFSPSATGSGFADVDLFVNVIPLPPAVWTGIATLGGVMLLGYIRRRK